MLVVEKQKEHRKKKLHVLVYLYSWCFCLCVLVWLWPVLEFMLVHIKGKKKRLVYTGIQSLPGVRITALKWHMIWSDENPFIVYKFGHRFPQKRDYEQKQKKQKTHTRKDGSNGSMSLLNHKICIVITRVF